MRSGRGIKLKLLFYEGVGILADTFRLTGRPSKMQSFSLFTISKGPATLKKLEEV
jgi:hypothetical protein